MPGLAVIGQSDFSGGMWSSPTAERIPANGFALGINALIDDTGGVYRRGGSTFYAGSGWPSTQIKWIWQGTLAGGDRTLFATTSNLYSINGSTITSLGATTSMSAGANRPTVLGGVLYLAGTTQKYDGTTFGSGGIGGNYVISVANRLVNCLADIVQFSGVGTTTFDPTDFWKIPGGVNITGLAALRDSAVVFTDQGTWVISNMALNLTDPDGNVQQRLDLYSPDMILLGHGAAGVVGYQGGLIVPARDGIWLMRLGTASEASPSLELLSRPIASRYKSHVDAGHVPGQAAVFRGHYFLPIVSGANNINDFLVCRLDLPSRPWTTFAVGSAPNALAPSQDGRSLIGDAFHSTVWQLATLDYFGSTATDAGLSTMAWEIVTRDLETGPLNQNTIVKLRAGYHAATGGLGAAVIDPADPTHEIDLTGTAPPTSGALSTYSWPVTKRARLMRILINDATGTSTGIALDSLEMFVRQQGRQ